MYAGLAGWFADRPRRRLPRLLAASVVLTLASSTACGSVADSRSIDPSADEIILLTASSNEPSASLTAGLSAALLRAANTNRGRAVLLTADGTSPTTIDLTPRRRNGDVEYGSQRPQLIQQRVAAVLQAIQLVEHASTATGMDLLQGLATAARVATPGSGITVISSGLSTKGALDWRQLGWEADGRAVAQELATRQLMPDLWGRRITFVGLGDTGGLQPRLPAPLRSRVINVWVAVCQGAGASSCTVDNGLRPQLPPASTVPEPVVSIPQVSSVIGPAGQLQQSIPSDLLGFSLDSAQLGPDADTLLQPLVQRALAERRPVQVVGHTDPRGTAAHNAELATQRATAVSDRLSKLGLPPELLIPPSGVGATADAPDAGYTDGRIDESKCAGLRRVVISLLLPATL